ncbi:MULTISPECIES: alpha/beta hydrolase [unclassified Coleofasciculus]|uniref:alpha/beta hydrolase n=1 Tax=unclassified Coleofasciculus TaxID=2692782 RepID=UPI0018829363|nr:MULTISPECIES: alpha/beta fold hydrolase [unclassified Coleofasciculus]MBE9128252.1 alpha/beta fold hydrolase [Coleofasciculus sp. LEGE 07081]MBE9148574.1 alpha/beta fold hydrolase [Coleofasciculus sp. LEGE 07092]
MIDYSTTISTIIEQAKISEDALPIRNKECRSKFFFHPHPTPKVCLFFHGFTAGPYQFEPLGKALFQAGYNVLVPLMPGHGVAGHDNGENPPPLPTDIQVYQQFVLEWLQQAIPLGKQVILGGYSIGGTLAAWLAQNSPQFIEKTLLFAPYLSSNTILIDWLVQILPFYYEWLNKDNPGNFGYEGFCIPALEVLLDLGQEVLDRAEIMPATPILMVSSKSDRATNLQDQQDLFEAVLNHQPQSWYYCFKGELNIPHTMMTEAEGNKYLSLLLDVTKAYVDSHQTWTEVQEKGLPL